MCSKKKDKNNKIREEMVARSKQNKENELN